MNVSVSTQPIIGMLSKCASVYLEQHYAKVLETRVVVFRGRQIQLHTYGVPGTCSVMNVKEVIQEDVPDDGNVYLCLSPGHWGVLEWNTAVPVPSAKSFGIFYSPLSSCLFRWVIRQAPQAGFDQTNGWVFTPLLQESG